MHCRFPARAITGLILAASSFATLPLLAQTAPSPSSSATIQTLTPAQMLDQLLSRCEDELVPLVEAMPEEKFNFAPSALSVRNAKFDGVRSFADQVKHIIGANNHFFSSITSTPPPSFDPASVKTKDQIVQALKDSFAYAHKAVATVTPENAFQATAHGEGGPTRMGIASFAVAHDYNHFGQLVEYLRMNGIVPPESRKSHK